MSAAIHATMIGKASTCGRASTCGASSTSAHISATSTGGHPYKAREVVFQAVSAGDHGDAKSIGMAGVRVAAVVERNAPERTIYDPGSTFADDKGYVKMPNVNQVDEMVNMISAQQDYQANLEAFNVAKTLALRSLQL